MELRDLMVQTALMVVMAALMVQQVELAVAVAERLVQAVAVVPAEQYSSKRNQ